MSNFGSSLSFVFGKLLRNKSEKENKLKNENIKLRVCGYPGELKDKGYP